MPVYQRNIIRQKLGNLNQTAKKNLIQEIKVKNQELEKIKKIVKVAIKQLIISPLVLKLDKEASFSPEIYLRLLYF